MSRAILFLHLYLSTRQAIHAFCPSLPLLHAKYAKARLTTRRHVLSSDQVAAFHQDNALTRTLENDASQGSLLPFPNLFPPQPQPQHAPSIQKRVEPSQKEDDNNTHSTILLLHGLQDALYSPAEAMVEKRLSHFVEEAMEHAAERQAYGLAWRRAGATIMAVLPLFGAAFALHLAHHDVHRAQQELLEQNSKQLQPLKKGLDTLSSLPAATWLAAGLFLAAGVADVVDAMLHVVMSIHMFLLHNSVAVDLASWWQQHHASLVDPNLTNMIQTATSTVTPNPSSVWQHINPTALHHYQHHQHTDASTLQHAWTAVQDASTSVAKTNGGGGQEASSLATLEEWSSACVLTSAMCVALGEVVSFCNTNEQQRRDDTQQDKTDTSSFMKAPPRGGLPQAA